ncbi:peptidase S41 [Planoprotostelium fungivorum]|uniref:Peptidase S41 n=1 Tax=Planoprotostelium fungivorum TaxID=1890364 RepID=A0A2P6NZE9_9EUKA|nr:peptidase S41 [Planoprotostelium fungivorum]
MGQAASLLQIAKTTNASNREASMSTIRNLIAQRGIAPFKNELTATDEEGRTPLHWASLGGHVELVSLLLELGADVESRDITGCTPLVSAVFNGHLDACKVLIKRGNAEVNSQNRDGMTPLHWTVVEGHYSCAEFLIMHGADALHIKNNKGQNAFQICSTLKTKKRNKFVLFLQRQLLEKRGEKGLDLSQMMDNAPIETFVAPVDLRRTQLTTASVSLSFPFSDVKKLRSPFLRVGLSTTVSVTDFHGPTRSRFVDESRGSTITSTSSLRRLVVLCKVWGIIKYAHPSVPIITTHSAWDNALVQALPSIVNTKNVEEYCSSLNTLLGGARDANTRCYDINEDILKLSRTLLNRDCAEYVEQPYLIELEEGKTLLVLNDHERLSDPSKSSALKDCMSQLKPHDDLIFDLRLKFGQPTTSHSFKCNVYDAIRMILHKTVLLPSTMSRMYQGYPQHKHVGSLFKSGNYITEGETLIPTGDIQWLRNSESPNISAEFPRPPGSEEVEENSKKGRWIFLVNRYTPDAIIDLVSALQLQYNSFVIEETEEDTKMELGIPSIQVNVGDSLAVSIRKHVRINSDGTYGFAPNISVNLSVKEGERRDIYPDTQDDCLVAALNVLRGDLVVDKSDRPTLPSYLCRSEEESSGSSFPSLELRYLSVFRLYNVIRYFYPYLDIMDKPWDDIINEVLPRVEKLTSALSYHQLIAEMVAQLNDSHAIMSSMTFNQYVGTYVPPILVRTAEGQTVVTEIFDPLLVRNLQGSPSIKPVNPVNPGLAVGDVILRIGDESVAERRAKLATFTSGSTPQALDAKINQKILAGEKDSAIILEVKTVDGMNVTVTLPRTMLPGQTTMRQGPAYRWLHKGVGYIDLIQLLPAQVDVALDTLREAVGIILDVRGYPKGSIYQLAPRLASKRVVVARTQTRTLLPSMIYTELESCSIEEIHRLHPSPHWKFGGKIIALVIGDVILRIGDESVAERRAKLATFTSGSTPQALDAKINQKILAGEKDSAIILEVKTVDGMNVTVTLPRTMLPGQTTMRQGPAYRWLHKGVGYIDLIQLLPAQVDVALDTLREAVGIILDVRGYPKGSIYQLAPRLASKRVVVARTQTRTLLPSMIYTELESCSIEEIHRLHPSPHWKFGGKIIALVSEETMSHGEHTCLYLESCCDVTFIGQPTNGTNGNVTNVTLPGNITVTFTALGASHGNGEPLQRRGIQPHVVVTPRIQDIISGVDRTLQVAMQYLLRDDQGENHRNFV